MIGEIRDLETAQIAVQASLTGHLVLATLHTNDAASAVTRLADMGVEPYLLASSLLGVLAQRLVRTLCPACRVAPRRRRASAKLLAAHRACRAARRCATAPAARACNDTGYRGRTGVYELLRRRRRDAPADPRRRRRARAARRRAARAGMTSLRARRRALARGRHDVARRARARHARSASDAVRDAHAGVSLGGGRRAGPAAARPARRRHGARGARPAARRRADADRRRRRRRDAATRSRARAPAARALLALTTRQLATLTQSGMPLDQALAAVAEQADDRARGEARRRAARRTSPPASRCRRRSRAIRARSRRCIAASSRAGARDRTPAPRCCASRRLPRGARRRCGRSSRSRSSIRRS